MTLNVSGPISLGGSEVGESIAVQLDSPPTAEISLDDTAVRALAGKTTPGTEIVMPTDFYGKPPTPPYVSSARNSSNGRLMSILYMTILPNGNMLAIGMRPADDGALVSLIYSSSGALISCTTATGNRFFGTYYYSNGASGMTYGNNPKLLISDASGNMYGIFTTSPTFNNYKTLLLKFNSSGDIVAYVKGDQEYNTAPPMIDTNLNRLVIPIRTSNYGTQSLYFNYYTLDTLTLDTANSLSLSGLPTIGTETEAGVCSNYNTSLGLTYFINSSKQVGGTVTGPSYIFSRGAGWAKQITFPSITVTGGDIFNVGKIIQLLTDSVGNVYVIGTTNRNNSNFTVFYGLYILKFSPTGTILWQKFTPTSQSIDGSQGMNGFKMVLGSNNDLYIQSSYPGNATYQGVTTIYRLNTDTGALVWVRGFSTSFNYPNLTMSTLDPNNLYIFVTNDQFATPIICNTIKYPITGEFIGFTTTLNGSPLTIFDVYAPVTNATCVIANYTATTPVYTSGSYGTFNIQSSPGSSSTSTISTYTPITEVTSTNFISNYYMDAGAQTTPSSVNGYYPGANLYAIAINQNKTVNILGNIQYTTQAYGSGSALATRLPMYNLTLSGVGGISSSAASVIQPSTETALNFGPISTNYQGPLYLPQSSSSAQSSYGAIYMRYSYKLSNTVYTADVIFYSTIQQSSVTFWYRGYDVTVSPFAASGICLNDLDPNNVKPYYIASNGTNLYLIEFGGYTIVSITTIPSISSTTTLPYSMATNYNPALGLIYAINSSNNTAYLFTNVFSNYNTATGSGRAIVYPTVGTYNQSKIIRIHSDSAGNAYILGGICSGTGAAVYNGEIHIIKINSAGGTLWKKLISQIYGSLYNSSLGYTAAASYNSCCDDSGNLYITYFTSTTSKIGGIVKIDTNGNIVWTRRIRIVKNTTDSLTGFSPTWHRNDANNLYISTVVQPADLPMASLFKIPVDGSKLGSLTNTVAGDTYYFYYDDTITSPTIVSSTASLANYTTRPTYTSSSYGGTTQTAINFGASGPSYSLANNITTLT